MKVKKPLIVFFVPGEEITEEMENDAQYGPGSFYGLLELRLSTKRDLKNKVMQCVGNGETVVGIITETVFDWEFNIPILTHNDKDFSMQQKVAQIVELWGVRMLKSMQTI